MTTPRPAACVFCGSSPGARPVYAEAARATVAALAEAGWDVVYGGACVGVMGVVADEALARGLKVTGVIPRRILDKEIAHQGLDELVVVDSMDERKRVMLERSDAFLSLPGGFGTLDEMFEVLTLAQLGFHRKPSGLLDVDGYFAPLLSWIEGALEAGFVRSEHRQLMVVDSDPAALVARVAAHEMPPLPGWVRDDDG